MHRTSDLAAFDQAQQGQCADGFARAGFADQCEFFALGDLEADAVHHLLVAKGDAQVLNVE